MPAMGTGGQQAKTSGPPPGIVLLKSGRLLHGKAVREGDVFVVRLLGGEMRVPTDDVHLVCDSLDDAYRIQRRRLSGRNPEEHVELARWCLSYGLSEYARTELHAALTLNPEHRDARVMLNRIPRTSVARRTAASAGAPGDEESAGAPPVSAPSEKAPALPRSFERPVPEPVEDEQTPIGSPPVPPNLPRLARRAFIVSIEPVLFESCGASGCHGGKVANPFQLELPRRSRRDERDAGEANFRTVLQYVDLRLPAESPILLLPMRKHGRAHRPIFSGPDDPDYRKLSAWVFAISSQPDSAAPSPEAAKTPGANAGSPGGAATTIEDLPPNVQQQLQRFVIPPIGADPDSSSDERDPYDPETDDQKFLKKLIETLGLRKK